MAPYAEAISLGIVVTIITYLSLILGELVPKRIGLRNPEGIALLVANPMQTLFRVAGPIAVALVTGGALAGANWRAMQAKLG